MPSYSELTPTKRRDAFLAALRGRLGSPWAPTTTGDQFDCLGMPIWALREIGFLAAHRDPNDSSVPFGLRAQRMMRLLHENSAVPHQPYEPGDILVFRWSDVNLHQVEGHHIGVLSDPKPGPLGSFIHCLSLGHGGSGVVSEVPLDALEWQRLTDVRRLNWDLEGGL